MPTSRRSRQAILPLSSPGTRRLAAVLLLAFAACQSDAPTSTRVPDAANLAKGGSGGAGGKGGGGGGPTVASTNPSYAHRDTTLDVHVFGSGFTSGAKATWVLSGDTTLVHVKSTTVVSSGELVANVEVPAGAPLALYDVQVALVDGKKGVGAELFEISTAVVLDTGTNGGDAVVYAISEDLSVAGYGTSGGTFVYDASVGTLLSLGSGQGWGIDPLGTAVVGRDANFQPTVWVKQSPGIWSAQSLPAADPSGDANVSSAARATDGTLLAGGWASTCTVAKHKTTCHNNPAVWRQSGTTWLAPQLYAVPGDGAAAYAVSATAQLAGRTNLPNASIPTAVVWDTPTTYTLLDGVWAYGINDAGTIVVGDRNGQAAFWWRDPISQTWNPTGVPLSNCASLAEGVNDAGIIVGQSCGANGKAQATVWRLDLTTSPPTILSTQLLPGLGAGGSGAETSNAVTVTRSAPYFVAGRARASAGYFLAVRWLIP